MALREDFARLDKGQQVLEALTFYLSFPAPPLSRRGERRVMSLNNGYHFVATIMPSGAHFYEVHADVEGVNYTNMEDQ